MTATPAFSPSVVDSLRRADRALRRTDRGDHIARYGICRTAMASIAPVDSFVIGFFDGADGFTCAYIYENGRMLPPELIQLGPHSLSRWIRLSRRTYRYDSDDGLMLRRTIPFGDTTQISMDAVLVPLIMPGDTEVRGVMNVQSLQPNQYGDEVVRAAEWVGQALMAASARDESDRASLNLYALYPELDASLHETSAEVLARISAQLTVVYAAVRDFVDLAHREGSATLSAAGDTVAATCERVQVEISELIRSRAASTPPDPAPVSAMSLTSREREVARLIALDGLTNAELASRLHISPKTVKAHVGSILRKLGATQRSEIAWLLGDGPKTPPADISS